jgi:hypothetical protein
MLHISYYLQVKIPFISLFLKNTKKFFLMNKILEGN